MTSARHFSTDRSGAGDPPARVVISNHARANLTLRSVSVGDVERALQKGAVERVDDKTGHLVFRLDDDLGGLWVVAQRQGDAIVVLSAVRPEELVHAQ